MRCCTPARSTRLRRALQFLRVVLDEPHGELIVADGQAQIVLTQTGAPYPAFAYRTFWLILLASRAG